jgi:hypothetical protein
MDETDKKRRIIYENNQYVKEYSDILQILDSSQCKYTKNSNGVFLNLTTTDKVIIDKIYPFFVNNILDNDPYEISQPIQTSIVSEEKTEKKEILPVEKNPHETYTYTVSEFTPDEREILQLSQNYKI